MTHAGAEPQRPQARGVGDVAAAERSIPRRLYKGIAGAGVVIAALAGAIGLSGDIRGLFTSDPPGELDARITAVVPTRTREPLGEYLRRSRQSTDGFTARELAQPGYEFTVSLTIAGRVGGRLPLRWQMFRRPETPLPGPVYEREAAWFEPEGARHSNSWPVWVPYPPRAGRYFVRFTLLDETKRPASAHDSPALTYPAR